MSASPLTDLEIARRAKLQPIAKIADRLGIANEHLVPYGHDKAKVSLDFCREADGRPNGKLVLVTAINPTPAGEGKTTTTVGLGDALNRIGKRAVICLREPSLGPCFGMKGGAAGGGYAQVVPMEDINLHFTGDFHAISIAHNLLTAMVDNSIHQGNVHQLDPRRIAWRRVIDLNDRSLRNIVAGLGGVAHSMPRETGFDITAASEVMAVLTLATSLADLEARLGRIHVGRSFAGKPVTASDVNAHGAMTALLRHALAPNLVQTLENNPAFIHGGPFANIAHGCNSLMATKLAMGLSDYTITEAGFGSDLGAEKFFNIKCRQGGLRPDAAVIVATVRALKLQGGVPLAKIKEPDPDAVARGLEHLEKHVENTRKFGLPTIVCLNAFVSDAEEENAVVVAAGKRLGVQVVRADHWAKGGAGAEALAHSVVAACESEAADFRPLYEDSMGLVDKMETIAKEIYGAGSISIPPKVMRKIEEIQGNGGANLPVCMAKTQSSLSTDKTATGRPSGFDVPIRDIQLRAGAGFVLALTGDILTMPGLPKVPAAESISVDSEGNVEGLF